ncbi:hypothetical protein MTo_01522 [Microcystis aeruginosa NIES-1211]|jgi:hypothetical protein|uniref:Uncharacterized protein n=1 Tax=Microcystis aeruginosa NIES-4285 TaxID=2497681 RepID=A0A402DAB1_MICAE|nr:hypothetical protein MTo_01522 [Microcystis aeruginosa NIES-1211]GCE59169.1 hypothetical protein MiAbB_01081 [Microcystis aeruginosa NIES-4285]
MGNICWFKWAIFVGLNGQYLLVDVLTVSDYIVDTIEENRAIVKNSTKKLVECCRTAQLEFSKRSTYRFPP